MRGLHAFIATLAACLAKTASALSILDPITGLVIGTPAVSGATYASELTGGGFKVTYTKPNGFFVIHLPPGSSIAGKSHLDVRLKNNQARPAEIEINISSNNGAGWMTSLVALGPNEEVDATMPLRTGDDYGLRVLPSPTDTNAAQTRTAGNIFPGDVRGIYLFNKASHNADISVRLIRGATHNVPLNGFVDTYGQQRLISWPGKVSSVQQLRDAIPNEPNGNLPYAADAYGGMTGGKNYGASARFRVVKDGVNWFLVTPAGNRFFSVGVGEVGAQAFTPTTGRESLFTDLSNLRTNFPNQFQTAGGVETFNPYGINLQRKFGNDWKTEVVPLFMSRMRSWGFNTVGMSSWDAFMQQPIASTFGISVTSPHAQFYGYQGRLLPDIWSSTWTTALKGDLAKRLNESRANQPHNIGIFVDNELPWGLGRSTNINSRNGLAVAALNSPGTQTHNQLINQLKTKYVTINALNGAWGSTFANWAAVSAGDIEFPNDAPAAVETDLRRFTRTYAQLYFRRVKEAIVASGYKGLYLGCRFTTVDYTPDVVNAAKQHVDVLSFNMYELFPGQTNPDVRNQDFPVMISEFSFGANDQGRVGMPLYATTTESSRVDAYKRFFGGLKTWKNLVGAHWYRWEDFPSTGKSDWDNTHEGLVSITDQFYNGLVRQAASSTSAHMNYLKALP